LFALFCVVAQFALAHDPGISTAQGELKEGALFLTTGFAPADAEQLLTPATRPNQNWTALEFEAVREELLKVAPLLWEVRLGEKLLPPGEVGVELLPGDNVSFRVVFPGASRAQTLTLRAIKLPELPTGHRQFVVIADNAGSTITKKLLKAQDITVEVPLSAPSDNLRSNDAAPADATWWEFIKLGVEHIWTGYDHLLFLFALLLVCRSFRSIVAIVSCFTLAHSLTLALATFDVINLPARLVEAAIAASIVFVGVENLVRRGEEPRGRWALTFVFGLVHGFGFASVLRDLGVGGESRTVAMPLLTFNVGVELGQIAIACVVLPLVWQMRKREWFVRRAVPLLSVGVALAGLYWLVERTLFS
jgi:hydrogenase/urease accessory protein HupE